MPIEIDSDNIEDVKSSSEIWVLDFWAEWCGPCKKMKPIYEEVAEETEGANFGKVDMDSEGDIGTEFSVRAMPTLVIMKDGEELARNSGMMRKEQLEDWIAENAA